MFEKLLGLPAHPLLLHFAVVLVPMLVAASLAYALVPYVRRWITWAVLGLAVVTPFAVWFTTLSGNAFRNRLVARNMVSPEFLVKITQHKDFGDKTLWSVIPLAVLVTLAVALVELARRSGTAPSPTSRVITIALNVAIVFFAGASAYYVFKTGDSGARIVWGAF
ncbi:MAG TPA: DUF2231 domain-containing protein [Micromonosporaceae bacterium]|nr:DUF2231 domain-containing protein [Micromonosporaceae bacterium]